MKQVTVGATDQLSGRLPVCCGVVKILDALKLRLGVAGTSVKSWLGSSKVRPCGIEDGNLVLECPTPLFQYMIRDRYASQLAEVAGERLGVDIAGVVCRVTAARCASTVVSTGRRWGRHRYDRHRGCGYENTAPPRRSGGTQGFKMLNDFVVAAAPARLRRYQPHHRGADDPVNPLFIHGSSGLGKTHLEQGLAVAFRERYPYGKITT